MRRASLLLLAALLGAAGTPVRAQAPAASAQRPGASALDGMYRLASVNGSALPISTPSSYGVIRSAAMAISGRRYAVQYVFGSGQRLRIDGTLAVRRGTSEVEFRPTTAGVSPAAASYAGEALTFSLANTFGFSQAELVFRYAGPLPPPRNARAQEGTIEPYHAQTIEPYHAQPVQPYQGQPVQPYQGQTVQPYQGQTVQPYRGPDVQPAQPRHPADPVEGPTAAACPAARAGNLVEPLSNGLALSASLNEIKEKFGEGSSGWDPNTVSWGGFSVVAGASDGRLWHFHINSRGICLNSGVTIGSTQEEVKRAFGATYGTTYDQYKLTFNYSGGRLSRIDIDPVGEFKPVRGGRAPSGNGGGSTPQRPASSGGGAGALAGTWYGSNVVTQITIRADGSYTSPNGGSGRWTLNGEQLHFTGPLTGWNGGNATFKNGNIEFYWKNPNGAINYFALIKGK